MPEVLTNAQKAQRQASEEVYTLLTRDPIWVGNTPTGEKMWEYLPEPEDLIEVPDTAIDINEMDMMI